MAKRDALRDAGAAQKEWSVQGKAKVKRSGETDKYIRHFNTASSEKLAAKAKISERALERLERVEKPWEGWELRHAARADRPQRRRRGAARRRGRGARAPSGSGPLDLEIGWQERIAILGPNGCGKTTLLHALLGDVPLADGPPVGRPGRHDRRRWTRPGPASPPTRSLLDAFTRADRPATSSAARSLLAKFALGADHVGRGGRATSHRGSGAGPISPRSWPRA